jgi:hypothetical protein
MFGSFLRLFTWYYYKMIFHFSLRSSILYNLGSVNLIIKLGYICDYFTYIFVLVFITNILNNVKMPCFCLDMSIINCMKIKTDIIILNFVLLIIWLLIKYEQNQDMCVQVVFKMHKF